MVAGTVVGVLSLLFASWLRFVVLSHVHRAME